MLDSNVDGDEYNTEPDPSHVLLVWRLRAQTGVKRAIRHRPDAPLTKNLIPYSIHGHGTAPR